MPAGRDLLVASAGGHLTQLRLLADRLPDAPVGRTWVTYDHPQAATLLADEDVVLGAGPSSRSLVKAVQNLVHARRVLADGRFTRVISTGSAIAVPFLLEARRRGIEAHYIESATRTDGPSLTGRILERLGRGVVLHTQHARWADDRWRPVSSVFDGFVADEQARPDGPLRVVVSLGTHRFPFPRLVSALGDALEEDDEVLVQHGSTLPGTLPGHVRFVPTLPVQELDAAMAAADVVVAHAGTGIALSAMSAGRRPVLVPRRVAHDEHVDDHQTLTAEELAGQGLAIAVEAGELSRDVLLAAAAASVRQLPGREPLLL